MKPCRLFPLLLPLLALAGCGGHGDGATARAVAEAVTVDPEVQTLTVGQSIPVEVHATRHPKATFALRVVEANGGALSPNELQDPYGRRYGSTGKDGGDGLAELYTAPSTPGTYHVVGTVTDPSGSLQSVSTAIVVTSPGISTTTGGGSAGLTSGSTSGGL